VLKVKTDESIAAPLLIVKAVNDLTSEELFTLYALSVLVDAVIVCPLQALATMT
jgi:hypothetical protein